MADHLKTAQRLYDALAHIAAYMPPDKLKRNSMKAYGLGPDEAVEYAYENVRDEAKAAIKGMRRPANPTQETPK